MIAKEMFLKLGYIKWMDDTGTIRYVNRNKFITFDSNNKTVITEMMNVHFNDVTFRPFEVDSETAKAIIVQFNELGW